MFGYSEAEALNGQVADLIIPIHSRAAHTYSMNRYLNFGEVRVLGKRLKLSALHKKGHEFPIEIAVTISSAIDTKFFIAFIRDLTSELEAAAKIETLQNKVLQLNRLQAMGTAAAMLAHELNQPLAAATNYLAGCRHLADGIQSPHAIGLRTAITHAEEAIMRAAGVVKGVREIIAKRPIACSTFELQTLINGAMRLVEGSMPVTPVLKLDLAAKYVSVNKGQFEQVLLNILKNAVEAIGERPSPSLTLSSKRSGDVVEVCVRDNGDGLTDEAVENLFSPFNSTKEDGLGVGLSICRVIVEQHGGKMWVSSDASGTAVCFTVASSS